MKKHLFIGALLTAALAAGPALATPPHSAGPGGDRPHRFESGHRQERMAAILGLSQEQQAQIKAIREEARRQTESLRQSLAADREKLRTLIDAVPFDETAVRMLAAGEVTAKTELLVARARTRNQIHAILTPEQRVLAEKLRPLLEERRGHRGRGHAVHDGER